MPIARNVQLFFPFHFLNLCYVTKQFSDFELEIGFKSSLDQGETTSLSPQIYLKQAME